MKTLIQNQFCLFLLFFLCGYGIYAQTYSAGLKGGINTSVNNRSAEVVGSQGRFSTESRVGLQAGVFFELDFNLFFIRPEAFYARSSGEFPFPGHPSVYTLEKISVPLLIGRNIFKNFDLYAGPAYQYFVNSELENATLAGTSQPLENHQLNWATQIGIKYSFNNFELDLRYDFTYDSSHNQTIDLPGVMTGAYFDDGRLNQFMLSLNWKIFDSEKPWRRNRSCYF